MRSRELELKQRENTDSIKQWLLIKRQSSKQGQALLSPHCFWHTHTHTQRHTQWLTEKWVIPFLWADIKISVPWLRGANWARSLLAQTLPDTAALGTQRPCLSCSHMRDTEHHKVIWICAGSMIYLSACTCVQACKLKDCVCPTMPGHTSVYDTALLTYR